MKILGELSVNAILEIYRRDLKRIVTNWAALMMIVGLIFLPSMYAWFNIKSAWNPYGNTKGLKVAIVNEDRGATVYNKNINIGNEVVHALKKEPTLGWRFTNQEDANKGVKHGNYYASIIIPSDFSEKISTVITDDPQKPELLYSVNEKLNIVAPKYTEKGASGIASEITKNFEKTVSTEVLNVFNKIGIDLQSNLPLLKKTEKTIFLLEEDLPKIEQGVRKALIHMNNIQSVIQTANQDLQLINELATNAEKFTNDIANFLENINQSIQNVTPFIKQALVLLQNQSSTIQNLVNQMQNKDISNVDTLKYTRDLEEHLTNSSETMNNLIQFLTTYNTGLSIDLSNEIEALKQVQSNISRLQNAINDVNKALESGREVPNDVLNKMNLYASKINDSLANLTSRFDTDFAPKLNNISKLANSSIKEIGTVLNDTKQSIPAIKAVLNDTSKLISMKKGEVQQLINDFPMIEQKIKTLANKIRDAKKQGSIEDLINFLRTDIEKTSDFYSNPIKIKNERIYPIPNYGTGMTPFYTTLALWVGTLLLVSLLTTEVHEERHYKSREVYFGRFLTFISITILQSIVVTVGNFLILGTYAANKGYFILFGIFISIVFTFIVYTFVSVFGNVGKGISIIFLVLQISGAGGVYPVQVTPTFFQIINPYLPFTYAISLLREATGGILWSTVYRDLLVLLIYIVFAVLLGVVLKGPINNKAQNIINLSKKSKIIH